MRKVVRFASVLAALAVAAACSSGGGGSSGGSSASTGKGFRTLEAVVVERGMETGPTGQQAYYMGFEAKDGDATAHMRYPVTRDQYNRYPEGTHVKLILADDRLRDIQKDTSY